MIVHNLRGVRVIKWLTFPGLMEVLLVLVTEGLMLGEEPVIITTIYRNEKTKKPYKKFTLYLLFYPGPHSHQLSVAISRDPGNEVAKRS